LNKLFSYTSVRVSNTHRLPMVSATEETRQKVADAMKEVGINVSPKDRTKAVAVDGGKPSKKAKKSEA